MNSMSSSVSVTLKSLPDEEVVAPGRSGCPGCGAVIAARIISKALGKNTIMVNSTGCMTVNYAYSGAPLFPFIHGLFENAGSILSGVDYGLRALGRREGVNLVALSGDGGTADIGFQSLSGAVERGHRFLYVCYDNEGYMNTGIQRSGTTPYGAVTTTSPTGEKRPMQLRKDMVKIMAAHGIPYAATATIAYPLDLVRKVKKAVAIDGPTYIHVLSPCWAGWGFPEDLSVKISKLAVLTGMWILYEVENGIVRPTMKITQRKPVEEYFKAQNRFSQLTKPDIDTIQQFVDSKCKEFGM